MLGLTASAQTMRQSERRSAQSSGGLDFVVAAQSETAAAGAPAAEAADTLYTEAVVAELGDLVAGLALDIP